MAGIFEAVKLRFRPPHPKSIDPPAVSSGRSGCWIFGFRRREEVTIVIGENTVRPGSVAGVVAEMVREFKEFGRIRYQMFRAEIKENLSTWRRVAVLGGLALLFLGAAWLVFSLALAGLIGAAFYPSPFAWFLGLIIVTVLWAGAGSTFAILLRRQLKVEGIYPRRTIKTLKEDEAWIQQEIRTATHGNVENPEDNRRRAA
jgi:Putative Actinobacterial Holin-X, holin superfamily III